MYLDHVSKLSKALYGLKQAPRAWYECLRDFLISNSFKVGKADPTLFTKTCNGDLFVCQIYVDDIIFGFTNQKSCEEFHLPNEVHSRSSQAVWDEGRQAREDTDGN
jgi:hypothetical protein